MSRVGAAKKGSIGSAGIADDMKTVVTECLSRLETRCLTHYSIALYDKSFTTGVGYDPFAPDDGYCFVRFVVDGQIVGKGMGTLGWGAQMGLIDQLVHGYGQAGKFIKRHRHALHHAVKSGKVKSIPVVFLFTASSFMSNLPPLVLSIAGSDCSAGAGIQADLKTFSALGCYGLTALTSVVAEVPARVDSIQLLSAEMIVAQIRVLTESFPVAAAKTGMLGGKEQIAAVITAWQPMAERGVPLVVDPVMVATNGSRLLGEDAMNEMQKLFPLAHLITPNMDEASALLSVIIQSREDMSDAAVTLAEKFGCAVLLKGGHLQGDEAPDVLVTHKNIHWLEGRRIHGVRTHGTGCTYSAAITAGLAKGLPLLDAVRQGKLFVAQAIEQHFRWKTTFGDLDALNHQALTIQVDRL